jgi:hypothetical protein
MRVDHDCKPILFCLWMSPTGAFISVSDRQYVRTIVSTLAKDVPATSARRALWNRLHEAGGCRMSLRSQELAIWLTLIRQGLPSKVAAHQSIFTTTIVISSCCGVPPVNFDTSAHTASMIPLAASLLWRITDANNLSSPYSSSRSFIASVKPSV